MSEKVKVEIEVFPEVARQLRKTLVEIWQRMRANETPEQLATTTAMACGMAMAVVDDICHALPPETSDEREHHEHW